MAGEVQDMMPVVKAGGISADGEDLELLLTIGADVGTDPDEVTGHFEVET